MLDDFSAVKVDDKKPGPGPSGRDMPGSAPGVAEPAAEDALSDDEFARQLQAGMAELMGEIENSVRAVCRGSEFRSTTMGANACTASPRWQRSSRAYSRSWAQLPWQRETNRWLEPAERGHQRGQNAAARAPSTTGPQGSAASAAEASFQETIRRTMERMQASGDQATAAAAAADEGADDFMAELLRQMQSGGAGLDGAGGEEEFSKMLLGMMEQLTNKDILYEPMKELNDKFPEWMEKNAATVSEEDRKRYEEQQVLVKEILAKFDEPSYSDTNAADREYIVDRMQKVSRVLSGGGGGFFIHGATYKNNTLTRVSQMQAAGSPPSDLVGDMPSAQEAFGAPGDESCNPQ